jgi:hypothetical protein
MHIAVLKLVLVVCGSSKSQDRMLLVNTKVVFLWTCSLKGNIAAVTI